MTDVRNDPIGKYQARLRESIDNAELLRPIVHSCKAAMDKSELKNQYTIMVGICGPWHPKVEIIVTVDDLRSIANALRELAKFDFQLDREHRPKDINIFDLAGSRMYKLGPYVRLYAIIFGTEKHPIAGSKCRLEQVGVEEVPIYEIRCPEDVSVQT